MSEVIEYRSVVKIERVRGPIRKAWLPARDQHITFGVHSQVAEHYGVDMDDFRRMPQHSITSLRPRPGD